MASMILCCPKCGQRFPFTGDKNSVEKIVCPECAASVTGDDFTVLIFCQSCRSKLSVPLKIAFDTDNICPSCGKLLDPDKIFFDNSDNDETTLVANSASDMKRQLNDGEVFDKFKIVRFLGKGGMAEVYLAQHMLLEKPCALKLMNNGVQLSGDPMAIKRFLQEAKLLNRISSPKVVKVYDVGNDYKRGMLFIAMEYVEGETLSQKLKAGHRFTEDELWEILRDMTEALIELEQKKVVHRDIKPSNIMQTTAGELKLMDLGIAKMSGKSKEGELTLTMEKSTIGTLNYASPEQCKSARDVDCRSDIYSLGATIYHLAGNVLPFEGDSPVATILNVLQKELEPLSSLRPDLSSDMVNTVMQMMAKKPDDRPENPTLLMEKITGIMAKRGSSFFVRIFKTLKNIFSRTPAKAEKNITPPTPPDVRQKPDLQPQEQQPDAADKTIYTTPFAPVNIATQKEPEKIEQNSSGKTPFIKNIFRSKWTWDILAVVVLTTVIANFGKMYVAYYRWKYDKEVEAPSLSKQLVKLFSFIAKKETSSGKDGDKQEKIDGNNDSDKEKNNDFEGKEKPDYNVQLVLENLPPYSGKPFSDLTGELRDDHLPTADITLPADPFCVSYDFSQKLPLNSGFHNRKVQGGALHLNGDAIKKERNMIPFDDFIYVNMFNNSMNMTVAMDIMIFSEKDQTIFALNSNRFMHDDNANILSMKIVGGKLEFSIFQKYIAKTNISLPKNKWINITFSIDREKELFTVFSDKKLLGAFSLPKTNGLPKAAIFGEKTFFTGQVATLHIWNKPVQINSIQPDSYGKISTAVRRVACDFADNGFMVTPFPGSVLQGHLTDYSKWPETTAAGVTHSGKPILVLMVNLKLKSCCDLLHNLRNDPDVCKYMTRKFEVVYLPYDDDMKLTNTMIYEQLQPIMKKFQRYIRLPAVVIFDRKSHIVSSHSRPKPEEFFKIISDAYIQAQNSGH